MLDGEKLTFEVLREDIEGAVARDACHCPAANALRRLYPNCTPYVCSGGVVLALPGPYLIHSDEVSRQFYTPRTLDRAINDFDDGKGFALGAYELELMPW